MRVGKGCRRRNGRRTARGKGKSSDESDEDYMVGEDEDFNESEDDYCLNLDGDGSEGILGETEEEEEGEEVVEKKVKKVMRVMVKSGARAQGKKKNGVVKKKKKRTISYRDEDGEDDDDSDYNFDDEKINKVVKPRKKKRVSYRGKGDECDGMDSYFSDVNLNKVLKPRKEKRVSYREQLDDYDGTDEDFDDVNINKVVNASGKKRLSYKDEDENFDASFDYEKVSKVPQVRKIQGVSYSEEDDDYNSIDDDDDNEDEVEDDEEFTPDEIDGVDGEELPAITKKKRVGRPRLQGKRITKGSRRKRKFKILKKKNTKRKKPRSYRPSRKRITSSDGESLGVKPIKKANNKKVARRGRKRRLTVDSDLDFVSSGSSAYEFTISEEVREQIREANEFCGKFPTGSRTSSDKIEAEKDRLTQSKRPAKKGKEKVEDLKVEAGKQVCGICLTEEGKTTVKGTLSCCIHYFCFACIMEWSKVESRCPLCKQRFVTISKPAKSNAALDSRTVVIQIPERDQVYQPSEEELQGFLNPYDDVICTECHQGGDDALMLLCDLCDSPAHTYCVGLGHEVPEGNWYCEGCRPTVLPSSNSEVLNSTPYNRTDSHLSVNLTPISSTRETFDLNEIYVPDTPMTEETRQLLSPRPLAGDGQLPSPASGSGALTVLDRRRIQRQIHQLLNNRRRRMDDRTSESQATVSANILFDSQVGRSREFTAQHAVTPDRLPSNNLFSHEISRENIMPSLRNMDMSSPRLTHVGEQLCQNRPPMSSSRSLYGGYSQNAMSGLQTASAFGLDHHQFQPCSSRSNIGSDASISSCNIEKEQVQSMVKSQLKSLSRDCEIAYGTFKDIARASTHTILAACGVGHRGSEVYPVETRLTCEHTEKLGNGLIGAAAKGHCSTCFDSFVGNVVREIMNKKSCNAVQR